MQKMIQICIFLAAGLATTMAFGDRPEFSHHCDFCECFVKYENRDLKLPNLPYLEIVYPTEDECLAFCFQDRRCFSALYGIVGGNAGIICELYNVSNAIPNNLLVYQFGMNYYEPRTNWPCERPIPYIRYDLQVVEPPEPGRSEFRKHFATKPNPNNWGRKRRR